VRGQSAIVSVLSPAALQGARRRVDLKFVVDVEGDGVPEVLMRSFVLDQTRPSAAIALDVTFDGAIMFDGQSVGRMPANVAAVDIAGHEITHGVTGNEPGTTSSLQLVDADTKKTTVAISMGEGERY